MKKTLFAVAAAMLLSASTASAAQQFSLSGGQLGVHGIVDYYYSGTSGLGLGANYSKVLIPEGVLHLTNGVRDEIAMDLGVDYIHYSWGDVDWYTAANGWQAVSLSFNELLFSVGGMWNFWLTPQFAVYPKLQLGFGFGWWNEDLGRYMPSAGGFFFQGAAGVLYKLDTLTLKAEAGSGMLKLGVMFAM